MDIITLNALANLLGANCFLFGYLYLKRRHSSSKQWCLHFSYIAFILFLTSLLLCISELGQPNAVVAVVPNILYSAVLTLHLLLSLFLPAIIIFTIWSNLSGRFKRYRKHLVMYWVFPAWMLATLSGLFLYKFSGRI